MLEREAAPFRERDGGQGRIRTSVARKERQIYSLLPLTTRPPVHLLRPRASRQISAAGNRPAAGDATKQAPEEPNLCAHTFSRAH